MKQRTNIQVNGNVYGGIHVNGCRRAVVDMPDDCAPARANVGPGLGFALMRLLAVLWTLTTVLARVAAVLLAVAAWVTFTALAISVWLLGRVGDLLRGAEAVCGGAPTQLVYVPSIMQRNTTPELGPGDPHQLANIHTRETDYVDG